MTDSFAPTRIAALEHLNAFVPRARDYTAKRNYDYGPGRHTAVSTLSPYLRHRLITEQEVLQAVLARYAPSSVDKFTQEVFWRTYWKGWLEMRPSVWGAYRAGVLQALDQVQTQSGLRTAWKAACTGNTGIECFDHWAQELAKTGYLHNHARMWFASIWIFTLRLPWELGADFFLRHLLDGDPASNTLSWRWVAGLQTKGKNYAARASNISKYTEGRFSPLYQLASNPAPLEGPPHPPRMPVPTGDTLPRDLRCVLVLHEDDLSPGWLFELGLRPVATLFLNTTKTISPLQVAPSVSGFKTGAFKDTATRWADRLGGEISYVETAQEIEHFAQQHDAQALVTPYAPVGPAAEVLNTLRSLPLHRLQRSYDAQAWPYATAGFFKFKEKIPQLTAGLKGMTLV